MSSVSNWLGYRLCVLGRILDGGEAASLAANFTRAAQFRKSGYTQLCDNGTAKATHTQTPSSFADFELEIELSWTLNNIRRYEIF
jgi:hypothetical protein